MEGRTSRYYPAFLDLEGRLVVLVCAAEQAERRAKKYVKYGADIVVVCPEPTPVLAEMEAEGLISLEARGYVRGDLDGAFLAVAATGSQEIDRAVIAEAEARGCAVTAPEIPASSTLLVPGTITRGPLQIAVSTGGLAPAVGRAVRERIESVVGAEWGALTALLGEVHAIAVDQGRDAAAIVSELANNDVLRERLAAGEALDADSVWAEYVGEPDQSTGGEQ